MKKNIRKTLLCTLLLILFVFYMMSCSQNELNSTPSEDILEINTDADYEVVSSEEGSRIVFLSLSDYEYDNGFMGSAYLSFKSLKEMKEIVTKGHLNEGQKRTIAKNFPRNDKNEILCCDFDNLFNPILPSGGSVVKVDWSGITYSFCLDFKDGGFGYLNYYTKDIYDRKITEYENFFDNENITVIRTEKLDENQIATYYKTSVAELMIVRCSLTDGNRKINIQKKYRLKHYDPSVKTSNSVPIEVTLYCSEDDVRYSVQLHGLKTTPSDLWLLKFGVTEFVES